MNPVVFRNIDISKIAFKKPEKVSEKITIFNVRYNNERLLMQTPKFLIPYIPTIYSHKNMQFSQDSAENNEKEPATFKP